MIVPHCTRNLYISCSAETQFSGIRRLFAELGRAPSAHPLDWRRGRLDLSRRRVLERVLVSGHGNPGRAGFDAGSLDPDSLRLPPLTRLYLLGCYQGAAAMRRRWAGGTGIDLNSVFGSAGETESALTTCLLLHLLETGPTTIDAWFDVWRRCNRAFRPYFPMIRRAYARCRADPLSALVELKACGTLNALFRDFDAFLSIINRRPAYLKNLM